MSSFGYFHHTADYPAAVNYRVTGLHRKEYVLFTRHMSSFILLTYLVPGGALSVCVFYSSYSDEQGYYIIRKTTNQQIQANSQIIYSYSYTHFIITIPVFFFFRFYIPVSRSIRCCSAQQVLYPHRCRLSYPTVSLLSLCLREYRKTARSHTTRRFFRCPYQADNRRHSRAFFLRRYL